MLDIHTCTECRANKDQVEEELVSPPGGRAVYQGWRDGSIASASAAIGGGVGTGTLEGFKPLCGGARMNLVLEVSPHEPRMGHLVKGQSLTRVVMPVRFPVDDLWPRHARV